MVISEEGYCIAYLGLVAFVFIAGLELDLASIRRQGRSTLITSISGVIFPFALGYAMVVLMPQLWNIIDYAALKSGGIIMQKDDDFFALRLRLPGGCIASELLPKIAQVARKYGRGQVRLTARAGIEIPLINCESKLK